jgi:hypothetical protein
LNDLIDRLTDEGASPIKFIKNSKNNLLYPSTKQPDGQTNVFGAINLQEEKVMKNQLIIWTAIVAIGLISFGSADAQFPMLKLPKIKKPATEPTAPTSETQTAAPRASQAASTSTPANGGCKDDAAVGIHLGNIETTRKEAADYRPGARAYYVEDFNDNENIYLKAALSPKERNEWLKDWPTDDVKCLTPALDELAEVARKTLPSYSGPPYNFHNPAEEKLLLTDIDDISEAKVLRAGFKEASWLIAKDRYDFPTSRFKHGIVYARYPNVDDGFCRVLYVNIVQDYAGGGTYADSHASYISTEFAGCPAGK